MIPFRSSRKLNSYIARTKLYPTEGRFESFKCTKKWCEACGNVNITDNFAFSVTQNTYKINKKLSCDDKFLIYLVGNST